MSHSEYPGSDASPLAVYSVKQSDQELMLEQHFDELQVDPGDIIVDGVQYSSIIHLPEPGEFVAESPVLASRASKHPHLLEPRAVHRLSCWESCSKASCCNDRGPGLFFWTAGLCCFHTCTCCYYFHLRL